MKVMWLFSGGGTGYKTTVDGNPDHGTLYKTVACLTNKAECSGANFARDRRDDLIIVDYKPFKEKHADLAKRREAYFEVVNRTVEEVDPDVIVTTGFMLLATDPLVKNWYGKIMNGHPAKTYVLHAPGSPDLTDDFGDIKSENVRAFLDGGWKRKYIGKNAVYDAIANGEPEVATAVFFLDHGEDTGPNIVHSPPVLVDTEKVQALIARNDMDALQEYASDDIQERLKFEGDAPAIRKALELAATGRLGLSDEVVNPDGLPHLVTCDGEPLPYKGYQM